MFRFTIRELVLLTLVVAMALGWCLEYRARRRVHVELQEQVSLLEAERGLSEALGRQVDRLVELRAQDVSPSKNSASANCD
jgi:hypothetical protein